MAFYEIEAMEIMADAMEDMAEWEAFEQDMASNPYEDPMFPW